MDPNKQYIWQIKHIINSKSNLISFKEWFKSESFLGAPSHSENINKESIFQSKTNLRLRNILWHT